MNPPRKERRIARAAVRPVRTGADADGTSSLMMAPYATDPTFRLVEKPRQLFDVSAYKLRAEAPYDVADDGRFLFLRPTVADRDLATRIVVVQNLFEELKRLVPTEAPGWQVGGRDQR